MTKPEVKEYVFGFLDKLLSENNIKYIKWDMNRPFSETGTDNLENGKELWYRHSQAIYSIVDQLKEKHPDVQFEACASGGARTDLGSLSILTWCGRVTIQTLLTDLTYSRDTAYSTP